MTAQQMPPADVARRQGDSRPSPGHTYGRFAAMILTSTEMDWLLRDIEKNGVARTSEQAAERPVPSFSP